MANQAYRSIKSAMEWVPLLGVPVAGYNSVMGHRGVFERARRLEPHYNKKMSEIAELRESLSGNEKLLTKGLEEKFDHPGARRFDYWYYQVFTTVASVPVIGAIYQNM